MPQASLARAASLLVPARALAALLALVLGLAVPASQAATSVVAPEAVHPNVRVVQEFYHQFAAGNWDGVRALFAPDVEWTVSGQSTMAGTLRGLKYILPYLSQMKRSGVSVDARLAGAVGEFVLDARPVAVNRGGVPQSIVWVRVYELRGGRIARVREFPSDQEAADVFIWHEFPPKPEEQLIIDYPPRPGR